MSRSPLPSFVFGAFFVAIGGCDGEPTKDAKPSPEPEAPAEAAKPTDSEAPDEAEAKPAKPAVAPEPAVLVEKIPFPPELPAEPTSGHAVVKVGATLFNSDTGVVGFEIPPLFDGDDPVAGMTVNVIKKAGDRWEVETLVSGEPPEHHCAGTIPRMRAFRLRFYVMPHDLLPVLTQDHEHTFEGGTAVRLSRGATVSQTDEGLEARARGATVRVPIPAEKLGYIYEPGEARPTDAPVGELSANTHHSMYYAGRQRLDIAGFAGSGGTSYFAVDPIDDVASLVTLRNSCLELVARAPKAWVDQEPIPTEAAPESETEIVPMPGIAGAPEWEVKAGGTAYWADGSTAGQVVSDRTFFTNPREENGNQCWEVAITRAKVPTVPLCFKSGDIREVESSAAAGGIGGLVGAGGLGFRGGGAAGGGTIGHGGGTSSAGGGKTKTKTKIKGSSPIVLGGLDKLLIQRIVRSNINQVRYCYEKSLVKNPKLSGKVVVKFVINKKGSVDSSKVKSTTVSDPEVGKCIAKAAKRWKFPTPRGGGIVIVSYPFVLAPG